MKARYKSIVDMFADRIQNEDIPSGTRLPTHRALSAQEHISLATATRVYSELEAMGLVSGETGRGTFVREISLPYGLQTEREGDFQIGNTAFHVTTAPMEKLINRCIKNRSEGYRPVILTLEGKVQAAKQMAENVNMLDQISVQSVESFIGTNIEEIAVYDGDKIRQSIARLIRTYNDRIDNIESDKSLMIEDTA